MAISSGNWTTGKTGGTVVTDDGFGFPNEPINTGHSSIDYYGGYLIAESILKEEDISVISAARDLLDACQQLLHALDENDNEELINGKVSAALAIKKALGK